MEAFGLGLELALILAAALIGGLVRDVETVQSLATIGVILLMFTLGLEFFSSSPWECLPTLGSR